MSIMEKLGITKGQWESAHRKMSITNGNAEEIYGTQIFTKNMVIADIHWCPLKTDYGYKSMRDENARLMAVAPEMLETLIKEWGFIESYLASNASRNDGFWYNEFITRQKRIESIIKKAIGKKWNVIEELLK